MAKNTFVQSIKTIAESLIQKAGFDKTRSGKIVGVNTLTNTYSVRIDGYTYNNVRVVDDATYNVGDTVKVNIPCNQPSQMYIASSSFSDSSIGKKVAHAESVIDAINNQIGSIVEIDGDIYQLTFESAYTSTNSTHTGIVRKNGENVTSSTYWNNFKWYLLKSSGKVQITSGISDNVLTMPIDDYKYGMALILEWVDSSNNVLARYSITIVDNTQITGVATQAGDAVTIANDTQQYFWHTETGSDTGAHITQIPKDTFLQSPSGSNLLARSDGIAFRDGLNELGVLTSGGAYYNAIVSNQYRLIAKYTPTEIQLGLSDTGYDNLYIKPSGSGAGMYFRYGSINIATYTTSGMTLYNSNGYPTMSATSGGFIIYDGTNSQRNLLNVGTSGMTLRDSSNALIASFGSTASFYSSGTLMANMGGSGITLYASGGVAASFTSSAATIYAGANNTYTQMTANAFSIYQQGQQVADINTSGATFIGSSAKLNFSGYSLYFINLSYSNNVQLWATDVASSIEFGYDNLAASISYGSHGSSSSGNRLLISADGGNAITFINSVTTDGSFNANYGDFHGRYGHSNTSSAATNTRYTDGYNLRRTTNTSSIRFKNSVSEVIEPELNPEHLYDINIVQYKYNSTELNDPFDKRYGKYLIGYIAEQVREVYPIAVDVDAEGHAQAVNTHFLIPAMLALIQSQNKRIAELERKVS